MRLLFFFLVVWIFASCSNDSKPHLSKISYWEKLKDSFATKNIESFVVDSQLQTNYKSFHQIKNHPVDSAIGYGTPYLYSWQERSSGLAEFTVLVDAQDHGLRVVYFVFDKNDSLRSAMQVAGKGGEGGILFETRSHFISRDSLLKTTAATTIWDLDKPAPPPRLPKPKGDSSFFYLTILQEGTVIEKQFAEKKELNLN